MELQEIKARNVGSDIKAEIVAADLVENGLPIDDIVITPAGLADRVFSRDIMKIESRQDMLGLRDLMFIDVSREGLYNGLPEALFHIFDRGRRNNAAHFVEEYKRHKAEEDAARQFFLAFEKEIYRLRIALELNERTSILGFSEQFKSNLFLKLWPELRDMSARYLPALVLILPVAHKVIGNIELTEKLLTYILDEDIHITFSNLSGLITNTTNSARLGENYLGHNQVIGEAAPDFTPLVQINIGPLKKGGLVDFMPGGEAQKALALACSYLFPVLTDIKISLLLHYDDEKLILSEDKSDGILGFSSRI